MEVELSIDKIMEEGQSMIKITEVILGKEILEEIIEVNLGMVILEEVEVGLEVDSIQVTLGGMTEATVDQDQVEVQVPTEMVLDALSVGSMITLPKTVLIYQETEK